jgi:hypothetical protein
VKYDDHAFYRDKKWLSSKIERSFGFYVDSPSKISYIQPQALDKGGAIPEDLECYDFVGPQWKHIGLSLLFE